MFILQECTTLDLRGLWQSTVIQYSCTCISNHDEDLLHSNSPSLVAETVRGLTDSAVPVLRSPVCVE